MSDDLLNTGRDTYRVSFYNNRNWGTNILLQSVGILMYGDTEGLGWYNSTEELPDWMQRKLAVLMVLKECGLLEGVGRRITNDTFWVYAADGELVRTRPNKLAIYPVSA